MYHAVLRPQPAVAFGSARCEEQQGGGRTPRAPSDPGAVRPQAGRRGRKRRPGAPRAAPEASEEAPAAGSPPPTRPLPATPEVVGGGLRLAGGRSTHGGGRRPRRAGRSGVRSAGRNLKEWLREQFCDHPLEHCEDTRLHDAAYVGDLQTLRSLLQEESYRSRINEKSVWCCGWLPCTPLRIAATAGHGNCVDFLIQKGAEVDLVDVKGQTALYVAVVNGHLESAQILLEAGADPNGSRHHRSTPVYHASRVGRADILQALIRYGADVDVNHHLTPDVQPPFSRRLTSLVVCPLYISAAYHNLQCFRLLLQAGANPDFNCNGPVNTQGFYRGSPGCVMDAVLRHGCEAAFVSLLVEFGANLNLVKWESLGPESRGRRKVDPEALQVFKEARRVPRTLLSLCRVAVRRALGKYRLHLIPSLPLPDPIKKFLLYE
ncbi:PREDICTED: ankyrin repeat and SOCS box protein 1 [Propithecus coquereli]|uniref:ankyrin repeat and SOCS box protein 1 n=1 Tax=Propithecus coquereli TaxID=379532 RepID=UPI00063FBF57|nr:PREDICTED: ankyrin repeat and SOCS box protein 1 [Propithecus coquereli]